MSQPERQMLRIVHKTRYNEQTFLGYSTTEVLAPSSIRIQSKQVGLTANNLSYCLAGTYLHWWDAFPLPPDLSTPAGDSTQFGIAPGWGFAQIVSSTLAAIKAGTWLYGFLPLSGHLVDLQLQQSLAAPNQWMETSPHRSNVMPLYQRYFTLPEGFSPIGDNVSLTTQWTPVLRPLFEASFLLDQYVFSASFASNAATAAPHNTTEPRPTIHPLQIGIPLSVAEANLAGSIVVCLAAGTKTNRALLELIARRTASAAPAAVVEVTASARAGVRGYTYGNDLPFEHRVVSYQAMTDPTTFKFDGVEPSKVIVLDYGARDMSLPAAFQSLQQAYPNTRIFTFAIGGEMKVYTPAEAGQRQDIMVQLWKASAESVIRLNTSAVRGSVIEQIGEVKYFDDLFTNFDEMVRRQLDGSGGETVLGMKLRRVNGGIRGISGLEGAWETLCQGGIRGDEGVLVELQ